MPSDAGPVGGTRAIVPDAGTLDAARRYAAQSAAAAGHVRAVRDDAAASGELVWDPFDPLWRAQPFAVYERLRADNPVHRSPLGFWVFTRHADCLAVLRDKRASSDARTMDPGTVRGLRNFELEPGPMEAVFTEMAPFLFRDPPDHTRLRGLVQKAFTPRVVEGLRGRITEVSEALVGDALERGSVDLVADLAYPLPVRIIVEMLGVPAEDHEMFRTWSDAMARGLDPDFLLPPEAIEERLVGILSFVQYFAGLIDRRRQAPVDDLLSGLIAAEEQGDVLSPGELVSTCILLLVAGHETTVNLIGGGTLALLEHPDELARFRADPGLARSAVEEMLRYVSPVQLTGRFATEDIDVAGVTVRKGELAMLLIGSANRDPEAFEHPDLFDVGRAENPNLGFGFGIHHCLGAPLARLETQIALRTLFDRAAEIERVSDDLTYKDNIVLRGLASLPVTVSA
ncbi:MAG TPA: cytochrome P450 [Acidimicrobiales bacterium]|nr:cytochrome P450 [Acidimicrobiales bacterium]